jgi:ACT domain-containing protein
MKEYFLVSKEEIQAINRRIDELEEIKKYIKLYEGGLVDELRKSELNIDEDLEGFYTITDILYKFKISRQTFFKYRKLIPFKPKFKSGKFGMYDKSDTKDFFISINKLKKEKPELFLLKIKKAS